MSPALMKMWISLASMGFMFIAIIFIYLSRYKLKQGVLKAFTAVHCYIIISYIWIDYFYSWFLRDHLLNSNKVD